MHMAQHRVKSSTQGQQCTQMFHTNTFPNSYDSNDSHMTFRCELTDELLGTSEQSEQLMRLCLLDKK